MYVGNCLQHRGIPRTEWQPYRALINFTLLLAIERPGNAACSCIGKHKELTQPTQQKKHMQNYAAPA